MNHPLQDRVIFLLAAICLIGGIAGGTMTEYLITQLVASEVSE